jgi:hypothetical protein
MKVPSSVSKVLTNKYVLYFVLFLAVTNVLGYVVMGHLTAALFFVVVAYLISNFSQNMIVVLGGALLFTNILMVGNTVKEGLTNPEKKPSDTKPDKNSSAPIIPPIDEDKTVDTSLHTSAAATQEDTMEESDADVKPHTQKEDMNVMSNKRRNRIDYASTIEDAYGDLNNILGSDGIKKLTDDTQRLMTQQLQLADAMKSMTPLMENAKTMLQGFDLKNLDGLADLAKNFKPSN